MFLCNLIFKQKRLIIWPSINILLTLWKQDYYYNKVIFTRTICLQVSLFTSWLEFVIFTHLYLSNSMACSFPVRFVSTEWHWNKGGQSWHHICIARNLGRWSRMEGKHPNFAGVCACLRRIPHNCYMVCLIKIQVLFIKFHTELCSLKILMTKPQKINFLSLICLEHAIVKNYMDAGIMHVQTPTLSVIKMFTSHKLSIHILYQCLCI